MATPVTIENHHWQTVRTKEELTHPVGQMELHWAAKGPFYAMPRLDSKSPFLGKIIEKMLQPHSLVTS